jgi:phosphoglycerol transferase MdoB-like AlkP superfamily enzyme
MRFDRFWDRNRMGLKQNGWGAPDEDVFGFVTRMLPLSNEPFFYYVITMSSHEPFTLVSGYYATSLFDDIEPAMSRNYFISIRYVDEVLRQFIKSFRKKFHNTFIFIYGDHTPYAITAGPYKRAFITYDERGFELVPLIILTPDNRIYRETRKIAGYLDFAPTIFEAVGGTFDIRSNGINLMKTPISDDSIDFKGGTYSRELLFKKAENIPKYHAN